MEGLVGLKSMRHVEGLSYPDMAVRNSKKLNNFRIYRAFSTSCLQIFKKLTILKGILGYFLTG